MSTKACETNHLFLFTYANSLLLQLNLAWYRHQFKPTSCPSFLAYMPEVQENYFL